MVFYMKLRPSLCNHRSFKIRCGRRTRTMLRLCRFLWNKKTARNIFRLDIV